MIRQDESYTQMIHESRSGFVLAGSLTLYPAYLVQLLAAAGASLGSTDSSCSYCSKQAALLLIPVGGPLLATEADPQHKQSSLAPALIWGGIEAAGAAMLIVGLVGHDVPQEPRPGRDLAFLPFLAPHAEGLSMAMRW
jgi:hypothetical protein